jgi:hypothetical protein
MIIPSFGSRDFRRRAERSSIIVIEPVSST